MAAACGDATNPAQQPPIRTELSAISSTMLSGTVGTAVGEVPSVIVRDSANHPVAGIAVTFTLTQGGGVVLGRTSLSDSRGIASADKWTLGTVPGRNELIATTATSGDGVVFTADAVAGPPFSIVKVMGDGQAGGAATVLLVHPRVLVSDAWRNPLAGVAVTFAVQAGGGSVSGAPVVTDGAGLATSGDWVLGTSGGQQLVARVGTIESIPFTARIVTPLAPCTESGTLKAGLTATRAQLSSVACNAFTIVVPTMGAYHFEAGSGVFDTNLQLRGSNLVELAGNDDLTAGTTNSGFDAVLTPGTYTLSVSSSKPGMSGSFDVLYYATPLNVDGCAEAFVVRGATARGTVSTGCAPEADNPAARFRISLEAGDPIDIQVDDFSYSGPIIRMIMPDGHYVEVPAGANYLTALHTTAPANGYYLVMVGLVHEAGLQYELRIR